MLRRRNALALPVAAAVLLVSVAAQAADARNGFAHLVKRALPAVVNISTTEDVSADAPEAPDAPGKPGAGEDSPMNEFLQEFFKNNRNRPPPPGLQMNALGSGFIVDSKGYVVTNNHVVESAREIKLTLSDGREFKAKRVGTDPATDLAVLKIDAGEALPTVEWGSSEDMQIGDWVIAIGSPFGLGGSVTAGLLSGRARDIQAGPYDDFLQTDAAINRGHSGGPLFNVDGKVVGVNTAILSPTGGSIGISFAIPSSTAKSIVAQLRETGSVRRGQLGVHIQPVTAEIAETIGRKDTHGAMVASVVDDSPAAIAGLQPGDVIVQYEGKDIESFRQLPRMVAATEIGKTAGMKVWRDAHMIDRKAKITELETPRVSKTDKPPEDKPEISSDRATLGMLLEPISEALRLRLGLDEDANGVLVTGVVPDSPAARQGIKAGDIISEFDKKPVKSPDDVAQRVTETKKHGRSSALVRINRSGAFRFVALPV